MVGGVGEADVSLKTRGGIGEADVNSGEAAVKKTEQEAGERRSRYEHARSTEPIAQGTHQWRGKRTMLSQIESGPAPPFS